MSNWLRNTIRTFVPILVGSVIAYVTQHFGNLVAGWLPVLAVAYSTVYYGVFRKLEEKYTWLAYFLGALPVPSVPPAP